MPERGAAQSNLLDNAWIELTGPGQQSCQQEKTAAGCLHFLLPSGRGPVAVTEETAVSKIVTANKLPPVVHRHTALPVLTR